MNPFTAALFQLIQDDPYTKLMKERAQSVVLGLFRTKELDARAFADVLLQSLSSLALGQNAIRLEVLVEHINNMFDDEESITKTAAVGYIQKILANSQTEQPSGLTWLQMAENWVRIIMGPEDILEKTVAMSRLRAIIQLIMKLGKAFSNSAVKQEQSDNFLISNNNEGVRAIEAIISWMSDWLTHGPLSDADRKIRDTMRLQNYNGIKTILAASEIARKFGLTSIAIDFSALKDRYYLLGVAINNANIEVVKLLLDAGMEVDCGRITPLYLAAQKGNYELVKFFIECGANVDFETSESEYPFPLHAALARNHVDCVRLLLLSGAEPEAKTESSQLPAEIANNEVSKNMLAVATRLKHLAVSLGSNARAEFSSLMSEDSDFVIEYLNNITEVITQRVKGYNYNKANDKPDFLKFAIRELVSLCKIPEFVTPIINEKLTFLSLSLNACPVGAAEGKPFFISLQQKQQLLRSLEQALGIFSAKDDMKKDAELLDQHNADKDAMKKNSESLAQHNAEEISSISQRFLSTEKVLESIDKQVDEKIRKQREEKGGNLVFIVDLEEEDESSVLLLRSDENELAVRLLYLVDGCFSESDIDNALHLVAKDYVDSVIGSTRRMMTEASCSRNIVSQAIEMMYWREKTEYSISEEVSVGQMKEIEEKIQVHKKQIAAQVEQDLQILMGEDRTFSLDSAINNIKRYLRAYMSPKELLELWRQHNFKQVSALFAISVMLKESTVSAVTNLALQWSDDTPVKIEDLLDAAVRADKLLVAELLLTLGLPVSEQVLSSVLKKAIQRAECSKDMINILVQYGAKSSQDDVMDAREELQGVLKAAAALENAANFVEAIASIENSESKLQLSDFLSALIRADLRSITVDSFINLVHFHAKRLSNPAANHLTVEHRVKLIRLAIVQLEEFMNLNGTLQVSISHKETLSEYKRKKDGDWTEQDNALVVDAFKQILIELDKAIKSKHMNDQSMRSQYEAKIRSALCEAMQVDVNYTLERITQLAQVANSRAKGFPYSPVNNNFLFLQRSIRVLQELYVEREIKKLPQGLIKSLQEYNVASGHVPDKEKLFKTEEEKQRLLRVLGIELKKDKGKQKEKDIESDSQRISASVQAIRQGAATGSPVVAELSVTTMLDVDSPASSGSSSVSSVVAQLINK